MADWNNPNPINTNPGGDTVYDGFVKAENNFNDVYSKLNTVKKLQTGTTAPSNPVIGEFWFDESTNRLKRYDGTSWVVIEVDNAVDSDTVDGKHASDLANVDLSNITSLGNILNLDGSGSGLDADLVRGLPAVFTASLSSSGYQKLPSGLIIQWGNIPRGSYDGTISVAFPIAFPNAILGVGISVNSVGLSDARTSRAYNVSLTGFDSVVDYFSTARDSGYSEFWIAIGH